MTIFVCTSLFNEICFLSIGNLHVFRYLYLIENLFLSNGVMNCFWVSLAFCNVSLFN